MVMMPPRNSLRIAFCGEAGIPSPDHRLVPMTLDEWDRQLRAWPGT
jgi:hypothetical protein